MSTFRPPQIPQQPRINFTPGTALGTPLARSPIAGQEAAYFRDRREIIQSRSLAVQGALDSVPGGYFIMDMGEPRNDPAVLQRPTARITAQGVAASVPYLSPPMPQQAKRDDSAILDEVLPFVTSGQPLGVPPPRTMDQSAAYRRDAEKPQQFLPRITAGIQIFVAASPLQIPPLARRDDSMALDEVLPYVTSGLALGVPPPRTADQAIAYWRYRVEIIQPNIKQPQVSIQQFVPALQLQIPFVPVQRMDIALDEVLPAFSVIVAPAVPNARQEQPSIYFRQTQILQPQAFGPAAQLFVPPPTVPTLPLPVGRLVFVEKESRSILLDFESRTIQ